MISERYFEALVKLALVDIRGITPASEPEGDLLELPLHICVRYSTIEEVKQILQQQRGLITENTTESRDPLHVTGIVVECLSNTEQLQIARRQLGKTAVCEVKLFCVPSSKLKKSKLISKL